MQIYVITLFGTKIKLIFNIKIPSLYLKTNVFHFLYSLNQMKNKAINELLHFYFSRIIYSQIRKQRPILFIQTD